MSDTELLRQAQGGDQGAWRTLYARYLPLVWRHAVSSIGDYSVAEDLVGETFLALVRSLGRLDPDNVQLDAWLRGVLRRKLVDHFRQQSKRRRILGAARNGSSEKEGVAPARSALEGEEDRQQVLEALEQLPEFQRIVLEWKHIEGLSIREMAVQTGKTEKAIESTLFRARKEFRRLYQRICSEACVNGNSSGRKSETLEKSL